MTKFTILDGGMGRELMRRGAPFRQPEWSALAMIDAPAAVEEVHRAYLAAGAGVITTNSYALVPFHIGEARFAAEGQALAARAGQVARQAVTASGTAARVAGSLPPVCGSYRPDLYDPAAARLLLAPLIAGLAPHVDLWLAETLSAVAEAETIAAALAGDKRPLWLSFTLDDGAEDAAAIPRLRSGEGVAAAVQIALTSRAEALLFNCSQPEVMHAAVLAARKGLDAAGAGHLPVGVYANAFPPQDKEATANETLLPIRVDLDPPGYLGWARQWLAAGAQIIGGCCGIGPEHIAAIAALQAQG